MEPVVLDHGSAFIRAGLANPDADPPLILSSELCRMNGDEPVQGEGNVADSDTVNPIERGKIVNWEAMEDVWRFIFYNKLGWEQGSEGPVLVAEPLQNPKIGRERMAQLMFEAFNCSGYYSAEQALLSLYAVGRLTGCTLDVGHGKTEITPIVEGALQLTACRQMDVGGQDLNHLLSTQLHKTHPQLTLDRYALHTVKESCSLVCADLEAYESSAQDCETVEHLLPDGQKILIGKERMMVGEALFQPSILGMEEHGLAQQLLQCVTLVAPPEAQRQIIENVVLVGGVSLMPGFEQRWLREASAAAPPSLRPALVKAPEYMPEGAARHAAWLGGAILAKLVFPQNHHVSKAEYDESGPSIVHKKCF